MTQDLLTKDGANNTIPVDIASQLTAAFRKSQNADEGSFTKAAWLPAEQINSLTKKLAAYGGDGIRVYFGRYTEDIINQINKLGYGDKIPDTYAEMNTILLVITKTIDGKPRTDYFIDKSDLLGGNTPIPTDPENRAALCPEVCDGDSPLM